MVILSSPKQSWLRHYWSRCHYVIFYGQTKQRENFPTFTIVSTFTGSDVCVVCNVPFSSLLFYSLTFSLSAVFFFSVALPSLSPSYTCIPSDHRLCRLRLHFTREKKHDDVTNAVVVASSLSTNVDGLTTYVYSVVKKRSSNVVDSIIRVQPA